MHFSSATLRVYLDVVLRSNWFCRYRYRRVMLIVYRDIASDMHRDGNEFPDRIEALLLSRREKNHPTSSGRGGTPGTYRQ